MEQIKTLNIGGTREMLQQALLQAEPGDTLREPINAVASELVAHSERAPLSIYMCSSDVDSDLRNYFAFLVARRIAARLPRLLIVDCDFLSVGLSGMVPERDALGFLDLLLYGSSLDVITQEAPNGIKVIGAGSFPVSRKSPFVMDAFEETLRYLNNHVRCVIFCGPAMDDDENVHPIASNVDVRVLVRSGKPRRPNSLDPIEERVAAVSDATTYIARVTEADTPKLWQGAPSAQPDLGEEPAAEAPAETDAGVDEEVPYIAGEPVEPMTSEPPPTASITQPGNVPPLKPLGEKKQVWASEAPEWKEVRDVSIDRRGGSTAFPTLVIWALGIILVAFVGWWLWQTRDIRERVDEPPGIAQTRPQTSPQQPGTAQQQQTPTTTPAEQGTADTEAGAGEADAGTGAREPATNGAEAPTETGTTGGQPPAETPTTQGGTQPPPETPTTQGGTQPPPETPTTQGGTQPPPVQTSPAPSEATPKPAIPPGSVQEDMTPYAGLYLIHVSSFRRLELAKSDADYFSGRGYDTFITPVDLGEKGKWYRVYVGPFETRDDARQMKIRLDENPRVRSTRITEVPG